MPAPGKTKLIKFPPSRADVKCPGYARGGMLKLRFEWYISLEGRLGVFSWWFSWCAISWLNFPWGVNLGNYSSWSVICSFSMTREELELLTHIGDFTTLLYVILVILRRESTEWLESSIEGGRLIGYAIWNMESWLSLSRLCFLQTLFIV